MDNKDLETTEDLSPEALVEKLKEKLAIDLDTYSKIVDEAENSSVTNEDAPAGDFDNDDLLDIFANVQNDVQASNQIPVDTNDDFLDEDFIGEFESTAEIESPVSMQIDNDENLDEIHDLFDNAQGIYESDESDDIEEIDTLPNEHAEYVSEQETDAYLEHDSASVLDSASTQITDNAVSIESDHESHPRITSTPVAESSIAEDDDFVRQKLQQLFSDFDDDNYVEPDHSRNESPSVMMQDLDADTSEFDVPADVLPEQNESPVQQIKDQAASESTTEARGPKVYRFRKYDPAEKEATKLHQIVGVTSDETDDAQTRIHDIPDLETPDLNVMQTFGASVDHVRELYGENVATEYEKVLTTDEKVKLPTVDDEYVSKNQNESIIASFKSKISKFKIKIFFSAIACIAMLVLENIGMFGYKIDGILDQQAFPVSYIMIVMQMLIICAALSFSVIKKGFKDLFTFRPSPNSVASAMFIVAVIVDIAFCFVGGKIILYNFTAGFALLLSLIYESKIVLRDFRAFKVISNSKVKYAAAVDVGTADSPEVKAYEQIDEGEEVKVIGIQKGDFVEDFFARTRQADSSPHDRVLLPLTFCAMIIIFVASFIMNKDASLALKLAHMSFSVFLPFAVYFSLALPISKASTRLYENGSAIIGDISLEEYSGASIIAFNDKDIFPSYCVKLKSVKVYGDSRIDRILYNAASVFGKLGGPLSDVFSVSTVEIGTSDKTEITFCDDDGIEAYVDGKRVLVGKTSFLAKYGIYARKDETDDSKYNHLYIAEDDFLCAKFYIKYSLDVDFENVIARMAACGICGVLKTYDPNIDNELLSKYIDINKYPIRVVKLKADDQTATSFDRISSGVVSLTGAKSAVDATVTCERLYNIRSSTNSVKILAMIIGMILCAFVTVFNVAPFYSAIIVLYQLLWTIPTLISTKLYINR